MAIFRLPAGITPDSVAQFGQFGALQNLNNYCEQTTTLPTGQAVANVASPTALQAMIGQLIIPTLAGITGAFTIQLPSTALLLGQLGNTIPTDGSYAEPIHFSNSSGQTGTLTAGDSGTTISGTATIASGVTRKYLLTVNQGGAGITITNMGSWTYP